MNAEVASELRRAADAVRDWNGDAAFPEVGIVLGSGLAAAGDAVSRARALPYARIPGLAACSAPGHRSRLVVGELTADSGPPLRIAALLGRHHLYEGVTPADAVFGIRLLGALGVRRLVLTAAVGAIHPELRVGQFLRIDDHLNLTGASPLEGPDPGPEPRFPDLTRAWDEGLGAALEQAAARLGMPLLSGVYAGVRGPQFETPAEIRMLRTLGADVVGMSVVLEAIAARHLGMRLAGLAFASNLAAGIGEGPLDAAHVNEAAARAVPDLVRLLRAAVAEPGFRGD
jgi:inosine/guanosine/xanthosine phosphorylase family protein